MHEWSVKITLTPDGDGYQVEWASGEVVTLDDDSAPEYWEIANALEHVYALQTEEDQK